MSLFDPHPNNLNSFTDTYAYPGSDIYAYRYPSSDIYAYRYPTSGIYAYPSSDIYADRGAGVQA